MAFGDTVQSAEASSSAVASVTVTFIAAVAGNLLIAGGTRSIAITGWTDPAGWTLIHASGVSGNMASAWWWKIAAGGETSVVIQNPETTGTLRGAMAEFEGAFAASPLDAITEDENNVGTVVTSQPSGTTGTTAQDDELAVAVFGSDAVDTVDVGRSYTNSFTEVIFPSTDVTRANTFIAKKVLTTTQTVTTTFATTDVGDEMYGTLGTWKKAAAAGHPTMRRWGGIPFMGGQVGQL